MAVDRPTLSVTKPVSVWNKPLKADFKDLFKAASKGVVHGITGNWEELTTDAVDALSAIGLESNAGQLAWLLIRRALTRAIYDLVFESTHLIRGSTDEDQEVICDSLDYSLENAELCLDKNIFERPAELSIIEDIKVPFAQWLTKQGLTDAQAQGVTARLPTYFVYALNREWLDHGRQYAPIKEAVDTPFTRASEREQAWTRYYAWLQRQVNEGMLDETFGLAEVYVPLRAYYIERFKNSDKDEMGRSEVDKKIVVDLETELNKWLERADPKEAVKVISGGPGCGKSSFAKIYAAHIAEDHRKRILFVPLHQFDPTDDLEKAVGDYVRATGLLAGNPLDPEKGEEKLLIVFDGLDELAKQGKVAAEIAEQFIGEVQRTVERRNMTTTRLQVLISGRELVVQSNEAQFRAPRQVLHILPYYVEEHKREQYVDSEDELKNDQRDAWWKKYGTASGDGHTSMPADLRRKDLDEITAQPLLNYLVALTYARGKLDFSGDVNLNVIYADLLSAVHERAYAGHTHRAIREMDYGNFARVLEEIGLATWHGDGRTTTVREIEDHCKGSGLHRLLDIFQDGAKAGVTRLLTAFYFRQHGQRQSGDRTFEFTHKSFGEYLTASRITRGLRRIETELQRRKENPDDGWDQREALKHWAELCGPTAMDEYLAKFLRNEVSIAGASDAKKWQEILCELIGFMLRHGMPMELLANRAKYAEETRQARNAEEVLLVALNACARVTECTSDIPWPEPTSAGSWLRRLQGQRTGGENVIALNSLGHVNLQNCIMHILDLLGADLSFIDARGAQGVYINLGRANLRGANLEKADLKEANLQRANLEGANLEWAILEGAKLEKAILEGANLQGAKLYGANLEGANLQGAKLQGANLHRAKLERAKLEGAIGLERQKA